MRTQVLGTPQPRGEIAALADVVGAVGRPGFAADALTAINRLLDVGSWSVYQLRPGREPVMHFSASHGVADTTALCFAAYRDGGLYRADASFDAARRQPGGHAVLLRLAADEMAHRAHRDAIYVRYAMVERLSLAWPLADSSLLAVNLYHHEHQGAFRPGEIEHFGAAAPVLQAAVTRHLAWAEAQPDSGDARAALKQRCDALTDRELDVLERLLRGMTYDGIAADLGLSLGTVKTYRARAFERLDIHFKSELFARCRPEPKTGCRLFG